MAHNSEPPKQPTEEEKELAKQLSTYADAIAAFSFVQSLAFGYVIGHDDELARRIMVGWPITCGGIVLATAVYLFFVFWCRKGEAELLGEAENRGKIGTLTSRLWKYRTATVILAGVLSLAAFWLTKTHPSEPHRERPTTIQTLRNS